MSNQTPLTRHKTLTGAFPLQRSTWAAKGLAVGYGILSYLVVFLVKYLPGVLEVRSQLNDGSPYYPRPLLRLLSASLESWEGPCLELSPSECLFLGPTRGYVFLTDLSYVWIAKFRVTIIFLGSFCWHLREPDLYHVDWLRANCGQV